MACVKYLLLMAMKFLAFQVLCPTQLGVKCLVIEVNQAILKQDTEKLSSLWPQFSDVVKRARGLGEFSAERLTKMIEVFGLVVGKDSSYVQLVDEVAAFVSERTGEAQGALVLLKRAQHQFIHSINCGEHDR